MANYTTTGFCLVPVKTLQQAKWVHDLVQHYRRLKAVAAEQSLDESERLLPMVPQHLKTDVAEMLQMTQGEDVLPSISAEMHQDWEHVIVGNHDGEDLTLMEMNAFLKVAAAGLETELSAQGNFDCDAIKADGFGGWASIAHPVHGLRTMSTHQWLDSVRETEFAD